MLTAEKKIVAQKLERLVDIDYIKKITVSFEQDFTKSGFATVREKENIMLGTMEFM